MKIKVGQKFEWDTDDLNAYIDENSDVLHTRLIGQAKSVRLMQTIEDIKGTQALQLLDDTLEWQNGASCGFNPGSTDTLSQKTITTADIKAEKEFCNKDLIGFWAQRKLKRGAQAELEELPFEQVIMEQILKRNDSMVDKAIWQSDTNLLDDNLNRFNGFEKQIDLAMGVIDMNPNGVTEITNTNALAVFQAAFESMGEVLTSDDRFGMFASWGTIQKLLRNLIALNLFHYKAEDLAGGQVMNLEYVIIPGTLCKVWYIPGLVGSENFYAGLVGANGEFIVGTDTMSDFTKIESGYDKRLQSLWYRLQFRLGVTFPFANQIGRFQPSAS